MWLPLLETRFAIVDISLVITSTDAVYSMDLFRCLLDV
jgi:hypothetical protein